MSWFCNVACNIFTAAIHCLMRESAGNNNQDSTAVLLMIVLKEGTLGSTIEGLQYACYLTQLWLPIEMFVANC